MGLFASTGWKCRIIYGTILALFALPLVVNAHRDGDRTVNQPPDPVFSHNGGFYNNAFELSVEVDTAGASYSIDELEIRYTTDGSIPLPDSHLYTLPIEITDRESDPNVLSLIPTNTIQPGPLNNHWEEPRGNVFKINTIRARIFATDGSAGRTVTHSYLVDAGGSTRYSMPVVSLASHQGAFFSPDSGIYVPGHHQNYNQRGRDWERLVHAEFFEKDGARAFAQNVGIRIHGGTSRHNHQKSMRLYARSDYGDSWIDYSVFPDKEINRYKRLLLRNSGNDYNGTLFRDAFMQSLLRDLKLDIQYSRAVIVFLNGEYWGIHNIRDRLDDRYLQTHYGIENDEDYTILELNARLDSGDPAGIRHYNDMLRFLEEDGVIDRENYEKLGTMMDIENFATYQIANIYVMNTDWPGNNIQYWRANSDYDPDAPYGLDGRWRWQVFDMDFGFGLFYNYVPGFLDMSAHNTLQFALAPNGPAWPNPPWSTFLFRKLNENESFRNYFAIRFADLLNTAFREDVVSKRLEEFRDLYRPEIAEHIHRWGKPGSIDRFESAVKRMNDFGGQRPKHMRRHLAEEYRLGPAAGLNIMILHPDQGNIRVNTVEVGQSEEQWSGIYFEGMKMELEALPVPGYRFSHWEGVSNKSSTRTNFIFEGETDIAAYFQDALLHFWHFNNLPEGEIMAVEADFSANEGAVITYPGQGEGYMDRTDGILLNSHLQAPAGYGLRVRNPSDTRELILETPSTGYRDIVLSFALRRTANGARQQAVYYSTDGGENWTHMGEIYSIEEEYAVHSFDLSEKEEVNDNPELQFRIVFKGEEAGNADGNNRFDNIAVSGISAEIKLSHYQPAEGFENEKYRGHYFTTSGGAPPYQYEIVSGELPQGMILGSGGFLSGTPSENGTFMFAVRSTDSEGNEAKRDYTLEINFMALIHFWHFNNLPEGNLSLVESDFSIGGGKAGITYPGTGAGYMDRTDGSLLNIRLGYGAGYGLRVRNPSDTRELVIAAPSTEYENLRFSFAVHRTANGAWQQRLYYSPDLGSNWTMIDESYGIGMDYDILEFDLSDYKEVNNNPDLKLKIEFMGEEASGDTGNNRFDNISLEGLRYNVPAGEIPHNTSSLGQNYPNPVTSLTTIPVGLKQGGRVRIDIFSSRGIHIANIVDLKLSPGDHEFVFDASRLKTGIYIYRMQSPGMVQSRRMIIVN